MLEGFLNKIKQLQNSKGKYHVGKMTGQTPTWKKGQPFPWVKRFNHKTKINR